MNRTKKSASSVVGVLDLRAVPSGAAVRNGVPVQDSPSLPAELAARGCHLLLVLADREDVEREAGLVAALAPAGASVCWLVLTPPRRPSEAALQGEFSRLRGLLTEAEGLVDQLAEHAGQPGVPSRPAIDISSLSPRERDVLEQLRDGCSNKEIGQRLFLSPHTVGNHLRAIYRKLQVSGRHELLSRYAR